MDKIESGISVRFGCYRPLLTSSFSQGPCFVVRTSVTCQMPPQQHEALGGLLVCAGADGATCVSGRALLRGQQTGPPLCQSPPNVRTTAAWLQGAHVHVRHPSDLQTSFYCFDKYPSTSVRSMGFRFGFYCSVCSREAAECSVGGGTHPLSVSLPLVGAPWLWRAWPCRRPALPGVPQSPGATVPGPLGCCISSGILFQSPQRHLIYVVRRLVGISQRLRASFYDCGLVLALFPACAVDGRARR